VRDEHLLVAFVWVAMALAASLISIRLGISVALVEILVGAIVGNLPDASHYVQQTEFTTFLASIGSVMLTFLAGAEIDPVSLRRHWKASLAIGFVSFPSSPSWARSASATWSWTGLFARRRSVASRSARPRSRSSTP
jgi:Kef-type K+ transport system membrane component KefB